MANELGQHTLPEIQEIIQKKIDGFCRKNGDEAIFRPINYLMQIGGKRMRPAALLMAHQLFASDIEQAIYPALAIEVFHNFTLMHDDVMDHSVLRRGFETVHVKWNTNAAILSGDAMMIQSYQLICKTDPSKLESILKVFSNTALQVCDGQQRDMDFEKRADVRIEEYLEMIRLKTSVLLGGAMKIGAIIAGASDENCELIYSFGEHVGIAFQLQDDYLDAFGEEASVGKQIGGDILNDKKTFLWIQTMEACSEDEKAKLHALKGLRTPEKIESFKSLMRKYGVDHQLQVLAKKHLQRASDALHRVTVSDEHKHTIAQLAGAALMRSH